jgi:hypothetical protein
MANVRSAAPALRRLFRQKRIALLRHLARGKKYKGNPM